ncbi:MAG TPA: beta-aspartyl-peptidase [Fusobacteriaceae bacterium]|nr:beta-aspartyl-peptidase [Fusobacteriaceae bacterium]
MFKLIKNARVYSPKDLGVLDILICNDKIIEMGKDIKFDHKELDTIDVCGKIIVPGLIDQHIHIVGGGGEGSFKTRVPEVFLSELTQSGITTVIGLLGTDTTTRSVENLLAKTKALKEEGINSYCLTGSYEYPSPTITGSVKKDITFIEEILGVKLAISDHRSSLVTKDELKKLISSVRVAGMFSGKSSYIKLHMGDGIEKFSIINEILEETDLSIFHFRPTHVGRKLELFKEAMIFAKKGGIIDITASDSSNAVPVKELFTLLKANDVPLNNVTLSSDGRGSWSIYDDMGKLIKIGYSACDTVYKKIKTLVQEDVLTLEEALSLSTKNVALALGLKDRGILSQGSFADLLILDEDFNLESVLINGKIMILDKKIVVKGTYEL